MASLLLKSDDERSKGCGEVGGDKFRDGYGTSIFYAKTTHPGGS